MSGVGFWELILVFLIGLIVLGPERLPRVASQLGTWLGQARRMTRVMKRQLEEELNLEKDLNIRRPSALPPPSATPQREEKPDTYSPAHEADTRGSGVGHASGHEQASPAATPDAGGEHSEPKATESPAQEKPT